MTRDAQLIIDFGKSEKTTYAETYNIAPAAYEEVKITDVGFSARVQNCLLRYKINTVAGLLLLKPTDFDDMRNFGKKCIDEVEIFIKKISVTGCPIHDNAKNRSETSISSAVLGILQENKNSIIHGDFSRIDCFELSPEEKEQVDKIRDAVEIIDNSFLQSFFDNTEYVLSIMDTLEKFSEGVIAQEKRYEKYSKALEKFPDDRKTQRVYPFLQIYTDNSKDQLQKLLLSDSISFEQFIKEISVQDDDLISIKMLRFLEWCSFSVKDSIIAFINGLSERERFVLEARASGKTLDTIGQKLQITRERIRQIENKGKRKFAYWFSRNNIISKISALRDGDSVLTQGELEEYFEENTNLFVYLLRTGNFASFEYDDQLDAFIVGDDNIGERVRAFVENMPDMFHANKLEQFFEEGENEDISQDLLKKAIEDTYQKTADTYHRIRLSLGLIYKTVLETHYPNGVNIYDDTELLKFREIITQEYGDVALPKNTHAIMAQVSRIGILCGRGYYRAKQDKYISEDLAKKIHSYICDSPSSILMTNTIFHVFQNELEQQGVDNKYYLQGILRELYGDEFVYRRDYISKDSSLTSVYSEIIKYIKQFDFPVSKEEISKAFPGITDIVISFATNDKCILNYFGGYLHISKLSLLPGDKSYFKGIIEKVISDSQPHHCAEIYDIIVADEPERLKRLGLFSQFSLFSVFANIFADEYQFMRPYISLKGINIDRPGERLREMILSSETFDIADVTDFCKENRFQIQSQLEYFKSFNETHLLMNTDTLATIEHIGVNGDIAAEIEKKILTEIRNTVPISSLLCIHHFPKINVSWNEWLIFSVLHKWSNKLSVATTNNQYRLAIPVVAPAGNLSMEEMKNISVGHYVEADDLDNIDDLIGDIISNELEV